MPAMVQRKAWYPASPTIFGTANHDRAIGGNGVGRSLPLRYRGQPCQRWSSEGVARRCCRLSAAPTTTAPSLDMAVAYEAVPPRVPRSTMPAGPAEGAERRVSGGMGSANHDRAPLLEAALQTKSCRRFRGRPCQLRTSERRRGTRRRRRCRKRRPQPCHRRTQRWRTNIAT